MSKPSEPQYSYESEARDDWLDRLARFNQHFGRFARDTFGVLLIAAALMTFLALRGYTQGVLLTPWSEILLLWFGWGAYLIVFAMGYTGYALLRRSGAPLPWGRLFALELAAFLTVGLLAAMEGNSLIRAEAGADGGRIGWGMVTLFWLLGKTVGTLLMFVSWLLALMSGFNLWSLLERGLLKLAGENAPPPVEVVPGPVIEEEPPVVEEKKESSRARRQRLCRRSFENLSRFLNIRIKNPPRRGSGMSACRP